MALSITRYLTFGEFKLENMQVGAYGWNYKDWHNHFYPEDLPVDWRLDYYANTYRVVMVPEKQWLQWQENDVEDCLEAVEGDFYFYLEICLSSLLEDNRAAVMSRLEEISESMNERFAGTILFDNIKASQITSEQKQTLVNDLLAKELKNLKVTLVSSKVSLTGWQWSYDKWICSGEPCAVIESLTSDGKAQAALLKAFEHSLSASNKAAPLFVKDEKLSMTELNNLKTIAEILGY